MTLIFWTGNFPCLKTLHNKGNQVTARNEHLIYFLASYCQGFVLKNQLLKIVSYCCNWNQNSSETLKGKSVFKGTLSLLN